MIDLDWLSDRLCDCLRWQLANPGRGDGPEVPWAGRRIWSIFLDLNAARASNGFGAVAIGWPDIEAWARLKREPVRSWESDILRAMDNAYLEATSKRAEKTEVSSRPMSAALFDAVFGG